MDIMEYPLLPIEFIKNKCFMLDIANAGFVEVIDITNMPILDIGELIYETEVGSCIYVLQYTETDVVYNTGIMDFIATSLHTLKKSEGSLQIIVLAIKTHNVPSVLLSKLNVDDSIPSYRDMDMDDIPDGITNYIRRFCCGYGTNVASELMGMVMYHIMHSTPSIMSHARLLSIITPYGETPDTDAFYQYKYDGDDIDDTLNEIEGRCYAEI